MPDDGQSKAGPWHPFIGAGATPEDTLGHVRVQARSIIVDA